MYNVNVKHRESLGAADRLAIFITERVGTMGFFLIIFVWTVAWLGWNIMSPDAWHFDPYPAFVFWLFISNMIQLFLLPLLMVGQNLQARHSEMRAEADFQVNIRSEQEIETIIAHLKDQNDLIMRITRRLEQEKQ